MWILLIAAAAAPIPVRVTLYDGCMSVNERTNELLCLIQLSIAAWIKKNRRSAQCKIVLRLL